MCSTTIATTSDHEARNALADLEGRDVDLEIPSIKNGELSRYLNMHGWESELEQSLVRSLHRHDKGRSKSPRKLAEAIPNSVPREVIHVTSFNPALPPHPPAEGARPRVSCGALHLPRTLPKACTGTASREKLRLQPGSSSARAATNRLISPRRLARLDYPHSAREKSRCLTGQPFRRSQLLHSPQKTIRPLNGLSVQNSLSCSAKSAAQGNRPSTRSPSPPRAPSPSKGSDIFAQLLMQQAEEEAAATTAARNSDLFPSPSAVDHTTPTMTASPRRDIGSVAALTPVQSSVPTSLSMIPALLPRSPDASTRPITAEASLRVPLPGEGHSIAQTMPVPRRLPLEMRGSVHARWRVEALTPAATLADVAQRPHTVSGNRLRIPRPRTFRCGGTFRCDRPPCSVRSAQSEIRTTGGRCARSVSHESDSISSEDGAAATASSSCSPTAQLPSECGAECDAECGAECGAEWQLPCSPRRQSSSAEQKAQHASSTSAASRAPCRVETDKAREGLQASQSRCADKSRFEPSGTDHPSPSRALSASPPPSPTRSGSKKSLPKSALKNPHKSDRGRVAARWHEAVLELRRAELTPQFGIPYVALDAPPTPRDGPPSRITTWLAEDDEVEEAQDPADKVLSLSRAISREVLQLKLDELEDTCRKQMSRSSGMGEEGFTAAEGEEMVASRHERRANTSGRGTPRLQRRDTSSGRTTPLTQA